MIYEQLDDLRSAAAYRKVRVRPGLIVWLLVAGSLVLGFSGWRNASLLVGTVLLSAGAFLTALSIYLGQRSVVGYLAATYPEERRRRVSVGEIAATLLTIVILALSFGVGYYLTYVETGPAVAYLPPAIPVTGATLHDGWAQYSVPAFGFSIELPPDWSSVAYDTVARGVAPTRVVKFYAEANNKTANLFVKRWVRGPMSLDDFVSELEQTLARTGAQGVGHTRVVLPIGEAARLTFSQTFTDSEGSVTDQFVEYVVATPRGLRTTIFAMQFDIGDTDTYTLGETARSIASTFRMP